MRYPLKVTIPVDHLNSASIAFACCAAAVLSFIVFYLIFLARRKRRIEYLQGLFSDLLSEVILCEAPIELLEVMQQPLALDIVQKWMQNPSARALLVKDMVTANKSLSGTAADNVRWLYEHLELYKDSLLRLRSRKWHVKAGAILELAAMRQLQQLPKIYRDTNNRNPYVRLAAQTAVVRLSGLEGLRFLDVLSQPLTQWQQVCLLEQLPEFEEVAAEKVVRWLHSPNYSIAEFALRLVERYSLYALNGKALEALLHPSDAVRKQAVRTVLLLGVEESATTLTRWLPAAAPYARLSILEALRGMATKSNLPLLVEVAQDKDPQVRLEAIQIIKELLPGFVPDKSGVTWNAIDSLLNVSAAQQAMGGAKP